MKACSALLILLTVAPIASAQQDGYSILPGPVSVDPGNATKVTGTYTMVRDPAGYPNITIDTPGGPATGTFGGGCLLYRPKEPIHCLSDDWCDRHHPFPGAHYCVNEDSNTAISSPQVGGKQHNYCWAKPSNDYCLKFPTTPLIVDNVYTIAPVPRHIDGVTGSLFWRISTCQNLVLFGCLGNDNKSRFGTPVLLAP